MMLITSKNYNNINLHLVEDVEDVEKVEDVEMVEDVEKVEDF